MFYIYKKYIYYYYYYFSFLKNIIWFINSSYHPSTHQKEMKNISIRSDKWTTSRRLATWFTYHLTNKKQTLELTSIFFFLISLSIIIVITIIGISIVVPWPLWLPLTSLMGVFGRREKIIFRVSNVWKMVKNWSQWKMIFS